MANFVNMSYAIITDESRKAGSLQSVNGVDKLRTVDSIVGGEYAPRKDTHLEELRNGFILC